MAIEDITRIFSTCRERKYLDAFAKSKSGKSGHATICRVCNAKKCAEWYKNNKRRNYENGKRWVQNNPERFREIQKRWRKENWDLVMHWSRTRSARKRGADGSHTKEELKDLYFRQKGCCAVCKKALEKKYHADHIVPLIKGGSDDIYNIQLLCPSCNLRKSDQDPIKFMRSRGYLL